MVESFVAHVCLEHAADLAAFLDGDAFVARPTWMSIGRDGQALYCVTR
jgi:hypothetical protein